MGYIITTFEGPITGVRLNRPEVHNAFDDAMISELIQTFEDLANKDLRLVILGAEGPTFCSGADVNWMKRMRSYSYEQNVRDAAQLARLMHLIYTFPRPTIAKVHGPVFGGGVGLVAVCDLAIGSQETYFQLSEVKLGLIPATISPYLIKRMGERVTRELFLLGRRISAKEALQHGLLNRVVPAEQLEQTVQDIANILLGNAPEALKACKELLHHVPQMRLEEAREFTSKMLASVRVGQEAQEGLSAFLEKKRPPWAKGQ
jgi:methylglutaconyl-CoA hydratase